MAAAVDARLGALSVVDHALGREAHNLMGRPDLFWQQLHDRLQWADPPWPTIWQPRESDEAAPVPTRGSTTTPDRGNQKRSSVHSPATPTRCGRVR